MRGRLIPLLLLIVFTYSAAGAPPAATDNAGKWIAAAKKRLSELDQKHPGQFGVFVRDLRTNETLSVRGEETWYVASGVKLPVAIEVLRQVDSGKLTLDSQIPFEKADILDGAGQTASQTPGTKLPVRYLLEQMMVQSDNTASDLLIRTVGLDNINAWVKRIVPHGFGPITTLADVRRQIYAAFHPASTQLQNKDFVQLKAAVNDRERTAYLRKALGLEPGDLKLHSLEEAYGSYYAKGLNSATLQSYAQILEALAMGRLLKPESTKYLLEVMERVQTGDARVKASLPRGLSFAHKTGTQQRRLCDFGIVRESTGRALATLAVCVRGVSKTAEAEEIVRTAAKHIAESGLFEGKAP